MMKNVYVGWGPVGMTKIIQTKLQKLNLNTSNVSAELGESFKIEIISEYTETPIWSSSNEDVAIVDKEGNVTIVGYGTAYISVTSGELKGTCIVRVNKPEIPDEPIVPDEPETSKLDNTKIYYGVINNPSFMRYTDLTEDDVVQAIANGTIKTANLGILEEIIPHYVNSCILVMVPSGIYKAYKDNGAGSKVMWQELNTGTNFYVNGEVKLGDFYLYGEFSIIDSNLKVYVE